MSESRDLSPHARQAVADLLWEVVVSDAEINPVERGSLCAGMVKMFHLAEEEADRLISIAASSPRRGSRSYELNKELDESQRVQVASLAWQLVLADLYVGEIEVRCMENIRAHLNLTEEQLIEAKKKGLESAAILRREDAASNTR